MEDSKFPENKQSINNVKPNINFPRTKAQHELLSLHLAQEKKSHSFCRIANGIAHMENQSSHGNNQTNNSPILHVSPQRFSLWDNVWETCTKQFLLISKRVFCLLFSYYIAILEIVFLLQKFTNGSIRPHFLG